MRSKRGGRDEEEEEEEGRKSGGREKEEKEEEEGDTYVCLHARVFGVHGTVVCLHPDAAMSG